MEQAQQLAQILVPGLPPDLRGDAAAAQLQRHRATSRSRSTAWRTRATGRSARRSPSLFDNGIDPMIVIRWKDIYERLEDAIDATERASRTSSRASSSRTAEGTGRRSILLIVGRRRRLRSTSPTASTTRRTWSRRRSRRARCRRAWRSGIAAILNFVGAFLSLAGGGDDRQRRSSRRTLITPTIIFAGLVGAIAWNLVDLVLRAAVVLVARAHRRHRRRRVRGRRGRTRSSARASSSKVIIPALVAPVLALAVAGIGILARLPGRGPPAARAGDARLPARADHLGRLLLARPRHERRAEDDGRHLRSRSWRTVTSRPTTRRPELGRPLGGRPRSRSAPTPAAGGSSRRWAAGSSRWTRRRASPPRARAPP